MMNHATNDHNTEQPMEKSLVFVDAQLHSKMIALVCTHQMIARGCSATLKLLHLDAHNK